MVNDSQYIALTWIIALTCKLLSMMSCRNVIRFFSSRSISMEYELIFRNYPQTEYYLFFLVCRKHTTQSPVNKIFNTYMDMSKRWMSEFNASVDRLHLFDFFFRCPYYIVLILASQSLHTFLLRKYYRVYLGSQSIAKQTKMQ